MHGCQQGMLQHELVWKRVWHDPNS